MKRFCRALVIPGLFLAVFSIIPEISNAQLGDPAGDPAGDPDAPIDGGVGVLIVAGVGYGIKKARESRQKKAANLEKKMD